MRRRIRIKSSHQARVYTYTIHRMPIHMTIHMPILHHWHCERAPSFIASVREVPVPEQRFETLVQVHPKVQIRSSTLALKLCSYSIASSMRAVKLCFAVKRSFDYFAAQLQVLSQRSLEKLLVKGDPPITCTVFFIVWIALFERH